LQVRVKSDECWAAFLAFCTIGWICFTTLVILCSVPAYKAILFVFVCCSHFAEQIIGIRSEIVEEWKEMMRRVPQDHADGIRKVCLSKQMEAWGQGPPLGSEESLSSSSGGFE
jgi:hypothetical protein